MSIISDRKLNKVSPAAQNGVVDKIKDFGGKIKNRLKHKKLKVYTDPDQRFPKLSKYAEQKTVNVQPTNMFDGATEHTLMIPKSEWKSNNPVYKGEINYFKKNKKSATKDNPEGKEFFAKSKLVRTGGDNLMSDPSVTHINYKGGAPSPRETKKDIKRAIASRYPFY